MNDLKKYHSLLLKSVKMNEELQKLENKITKKHWNGEDNIIFWEGKFRCCIWIANNYIYNVSAAKRLFAKNNVKDCIKEAVDKSNVAHYVKNGKLSLKELDKVRTLTETSPRFKVTYDGEKK